MSFYLQKRPTALGKIPWPATSRNATFLLPVFIPFAGCATRCVYCAQHLQTGNSANNSIATVIESATAALQMQHARTGTAMEVAFFGGTFTALPTDDFERCLSALRQWREKGLVTRARCSTRPDAPLSRLHRLAETGFGVVELGIQSFDADALVQSRRGYTPDTAERACAAVRAAGLELVVQLLPGMPGVSPDIFCRDVAQALEVGAHMLRFYPCLVLRGTELARRWQEGRFVPWTLEETVDALAKGWLLAHARRIPVIRMGLAPEPGLAEHILAGPQHPALGALVQAEALCRTVEQLTKNTEEHGEKCTLAERGETRTLHVPRFCQGSFWGDRGSLRPRWEKLGITKANIFWQEEETLELRRSTTEK